MKKMRKLLLSSMFVWMSCSCQSMLEFMQGMGAGMSSSYYGGTGYSTTSTTIESSSGKEWHKCLSCYGSGLCQSCNGTGKSGTRDGKCHACDRTGNGKCAGCHGKGGYYV